MSSCNTNTPNINQTFIIEPLSITGGSPTLSACTALYTNEIISCSGNTTISLGTGTVYINGIISATSVNTLNYYSGGTNLLEIFSGDTFITGGTLNYSSHTLTLVDNNNTSVVITGFTDTFTTGGTLIGNMIYFDRNDTLSAYTVDLSAIQINDFYVTGGTFNQTTRVLDLVRNDNVTVSISGFTDIFTTAATYSNGYVYFDRNDVLSAYTLDLTTISAGTDTYVTGGTLTGNTLELFRNDGATIGVDLTDLRFSGGSAHCITDFYVTNIHGCSPITIHDRMIVLSGITLNLPVQDNTQTQIIVRNSVSGDLEYRDVQSIISAATSQDIYVTGLTFSNNNLTIRRNDNVNFNVLLNNFTGLTVTGSISANTISATTLYGNGSNLTGIPFITGGTTNNSARTYTFNNATGGSFTLTGITDVFLTGGTFVSSAGTATFRNNTGGTFTVNGFLTGDTFVTGLTFNNANYLLTAGRNDGVNLVANLSILASDVTITGGTYNNNTGVATFFNNSGGSFSVSGFMTGFTDTLVTGGTYTNPTGTLTLRNSTGGTFNVTGFTTGDTFVSAYTYSNNAFTIKQNNGKPDLTTFIDTMTGLTVTGSISATTYYGNGANLTGIPYVTGGSFSNSADTLTLFRNSGSSIVITGFTDYYTTGATLVGTTLVFNRNDQLSAYTVDIAGSQYWTGGSTYGGGSYAIKANNPSGLDAIGQYAVAEGNATIASGNSSHAEGFQTTTLGFGSHAEGKLTTAIGGCTHAEGDGTIASAFTAHAEGAQTRALGTSSHAEGNITTSLGANSHAEGYNTTSSGVQSHSEGYKTTASGEASHAEGNLTIASGQYSHVGGGSNIFVTGVVKAVGVASFNHSYVNQSEPISGASGDYSAILGGSNQNIYNGATNSAILGGSANTINVGVTNSVVIGGNNLTATTSNTVYVPFLNINNVSNDNSLSNVLVWDLSGNVKYRLLSSILSGSTSITAFTYNNQNTFTISNSNGTSFSATFSTVTGFTLNGAINPSTDNTSNLGGDVTVTDNRFTGASETGLTTEWTHTFIGTRFRAINTVSGTSSVWTSTYRVNTPNLDLGLDSSGITRTITADNSIIQDDILLGGTF